MRRSDLPRGEVVDRVLVAFEGDGAGEGELAFGQLGLWQAIEESGESKTVAYVAEVEPGTTVGDVADMLGFMVGRHQALRTHLLLRAGRPPRQRVSSSGEVALVVVAAGADDPAEVAEAVSAHWEAVPFAYDTEWPVRMAAVLAGGVVTHVVTVILHTSIDAFGLSALAADIGARDPRTGAPAGPVTALTPLDQAAREATAAGRRQNEMSLRHLERVLRTVAASRFGEPPHGGEPRYEMLRYRSPAIRLAIQAVAVREKVDDSAVLLACFAVGLARFTGVNPVLAMMLVSNRFRPGVADSVSALIKVSPFLVDVAETTVGEVVSHAAAKAINTFKNAYYDAYEQVELIERVERERGEAVDLSCYYNDRRQRDRMHLGVAPPTEDDVRAALARGEVSWKQQVSIPRYTLYLSVDDPPGAVELVLSVDTRYFSRAEMERIARNIEEAAVQAALDPGAPTRITRPVTAGVLR
ncbi:MAG: hypothetical protein GEV28_17490 [Actinophytocola sp.]|uniref:condensation domain-containing protein n=1 Tax=Actinophytocola sp. TaxID=1872138 RepID=UPI0013262941|nr:condensation domain-containing protein [Actinophytocola sp.]MPZ82083.1 hypothetical protein [Actinophytocola sp.]